MATLRHTWLHSSAAALLTALALVSTFVITAPPALATTPGKNGRIAFTRYFDAERSSGAIFTISPDGARERQVTFPPAETVDAQPDWSPDGSLIAFRRCVPDTVCAIFTVRPDGTDLRRLSPPCDATPPDIETECADETDVAFLPDGHRVVFNRSYGTDREFPDFGGFIEHSDIVIRDLSGDHTRVVLSSPPFTHNNVAPVSSPDGTHIAFLRNNSPLAEPSGGLAVFVMRSNGTHVRRITPWSMRAGDHPDWSPDGRWILFRAPDNGFLDSQLYVIHPDGSGLRQVTHVSPETMLLSSSFSPDGTRIVYSQTGRDGQPDIFTIGVGGRHVHQVTDTPAWESAADWGPRRSPTH